MSNRNNIVNSFISNVAIFVMFIGLLILRCRLSNGTR